MSPFCTHRVTTLSIPSDRDKDITPLNAVGLGPGTGYEVSQFMQNSVTKLRDILFHREDRFAEPYRPGLVAGISGTTGQTPTDTDLDSHQHLMIFGKIGSNLFEYFQRLIAKVFFPHLPDLLRQFAP